MKLATTLAITVGTAATTQAAPIPSPGLITTVIPSLLHGEQAPKVTKPYGLVMLDHASLGAQSHEVIRQFPWTQLDDKVQSAGGLGIKADPLSSGKPPLHPNTPPQSPVVASPPPVENPAQAQPTKPLLDSMDSKSKAALLREFTELMPGLAARAKSAKALTKQNSETAAQTFDEAFEAKREPLSALDLKPIKSLPPSIKMPAKEQATEPLLDSASETAKTTPVKEITKQLSAKAAQSSRKFSQVEINAAINKHAEQVARATIAKTHPQLKHGVIREVFDDRIEYSKPKFFAKVQLTPGQPASFADSTGVRPAYKKVIEDDLVLFNEIRAEVRARQYRRLDTPKGHKDLASTIMQQREEAAQAEQAAREGTSTSHSPLAAAAANNVAE